MRRILAAMILVACAGDDEAVDRPDPPASVRVVINEIMAVNVLTIPGAGDWIELYNAGDAPIALDGWGVTDDLALPTKQRLDGEIAARGHRVIALAFGLARAQGTIALSDPNGEWIDRVTYGAQAVDLAAARLPDGSGSWSITWLASPGAPNVDAEPIAVGGEPGEIPAVGDPSGLLFRDDAIPELELDLEPASLDALRAHPRDWTEGRIVHRGRRYGPVGVRLKGENSFRPVDEKPSFKVKIDAYVQAAELLGLEDLTLNNMNDDPSMMHERIAYWVARAAGIPASRASHVTIRLNGEPYGLYTHVETMTARLIGRWFDDRTGPLFEGTEVDFTVEQVPLFEHESGPDDRSALLGLSLALAAPTPAEAIAAAEAWVDLDRFRRFWATCAVIGQFDSFPYALDDYHVYVEPGSPRMVFLPWGMDETFRRWWRLPDGVTALLATACRDVPSCRDAFVGELWSVQSLTEELELVDEIDRVAASIAEHTVADRRKRYSDEEVAAAQQAMRDFAATRRERLEEQLAAPAAP